MSSSLSYMALTLQALSESARTCPVCSSWILCLRIPDGGLDFQFCEGSASVPADCSPGLSRAALMKLSGSAAAVGSLHFLRLVLVLMLVLVSLTYLFCVETDASGSVQLLGSVQLQCPQVGEPLEWTSLWLWLSGLALTNLQIGEPFE